MQDVTFETEITRNHLIRLPDALPVGVRARIRVEILTSDDREAAHDAPGNDIARLAQAAREAHLASGGELMGPDEIAAEVRRRRDGVADD